MPTITAHDLRRLAEKADAMRNKQLRLVFRDGIPDVEEIPQGSTIDDGDTGVFTRSEPGHVPLSAIRLERPRGRALTIAGNERYDAAVWQESAVQKFVFPYYAATDSRQKFEDAWSGYWSATADNPIYAVLHDRSRPGYMSRDGVRVYSTFSAVTDPGSDLLEFVERQVEGPEGAQQVELAQQGIVPLETMAAFLRR